MVLRLFLFQVNLHHHPLFGVLQLPAADLPVPPERVVPECLNDEFYPGDEVGQKDSRVGEDAEDSDSSSTVPPGPHFPTW